MMRGRTFALWCGLLLLAVGLFWLSSIVSVTSSWGMGWRIAGVNIASGLVLVPLIAGLVWLFFDYEALGAKILSGLGVVIIVASIIMSVRLHVHDTSLFVFILTFTFIAGGLGLLLRFFFGEKSQLH